MAPQGCTNGTQGRENIYQINCVHIDDWLCAEGDLFYVVKNSDESIVAGPYNQWTDAKNAADNYHCNGNGNDGNNVIYLILGSLVIITIIVFIFLMRKNI